MPESFLDRARKNLLSEFSPSPSTSRNRSGRRNTPASTGSNAAQVQSNIQTQPGLTKGFNRTQVFSWLAPKPKPPPTLSPESTPAVKNALWFANDLQLAASVVIIQPSTARFVVLSEKRTQVFKSSEEGKEDEKIEYERWFLPRGRKDQGETIEHTAMREGYEESGYRCTLMPLNIPTRATRPLDSDKKPKIPRYPNTEPFYVEVIHNPPPDRFNFQTSKWEQPEYGGTEYICFYYIAEIPADAEPETGTKMWDEQGYVTHLLPFEEVLKKFERDPHQWHIVKKAGDIYRDSLAAEEMEKKKREAIEQEARRERSKQRKGARPGQDHSIRIRPQQSERQHSF